MSGFLTHANDARDYLARLILHARTAIEKQARRQGLSPEAAWDLAIGGHEPRAADDEAGGPCRARGASSRVRASGPGGAARRSVERRVAWPGLGSRACRGSGGWSATGSTRRSWPTSRRPTPPGQAPGPIVVGHDGRVSAPVFLPAVLSAVTATGRDALLAGPVATPTLGRLVRDLGAAGGIQISASHNPPKYNGLKFFQPGGMVLGPIEGRAMLDRLEARALGWASWDELGQVRTLDEPDGRHLDLVLATVDVAAIRRRQVRRRPRRLPRLGRPAGRGAAPGPGVRGGRPGRRPRRPVRPPARADRGQPPAVLGDGPRPRGGGRVRPGPRRRPPGDRRRDRPLHRRGADPRPGRLAPAGPGDRAGRAQPLDLADDRGPGRAGPAAR